jgi:hypothetical protein
MPFFILVMGLKYLAKGLHTEMRNHVQHPCEKYGENYRTNVRTSEIQIKMTEPPAYKFG